MIYSPVAAGEGGKDMVWMVGSKRHSAEDVVRKLRGADEFTAPKSNYRFRPPGGTGRSV